MPHVALYMSCRLWFTVCCAGLASASDNTKEEEEKDKRLAAGKALACAQAVVEHLGALHGCC
jgi:hypothetical protein